MDKDFALLLTGAGIALVSSMIATLLQHYLSLRADRIGRKRDREDRLKRELVTGPERVITFEQVVKALADLEKLKVNQESLEQFYRHFQMTIKGAREDIEERAFQLAQTSRQDFGRKTDDLNSFAQQFDKFKTEFEPLEEEREGEPRPRFSPRVPYIYGIAAHYANRPETAKHYLGEVVRFQQPEDDEDTISYNLRVANTYYYLGLIESIFGNHEKAIDLFEEAKKRDLQDKDFLTRAVTAEAYVMIDSFGKARRYLDHVEERLREIERVEPLRNFQLRVQSRTALIRANMAILERTANWRREVQQLLEPVHEVEPQYYYATTTLAQVYYQQGDASAKKKAQELFGEAYRDVERSGHLITVTEVRSKILLLMVAGMCCKHGPRDEKRSEMHLDEANSLLGSLPKMGFQTCTVFSTLSKRNEDVGTIRHHIELIREGKVLL